MLWRAGLLVAVTLLGLGWSIVERGRFLRVKSAPLAERLPVGREPTEAERQAAIREQLREMNRLRGRADFALLVGLGPGLVGLTWAAVRGRRQTPNDPLLQTGGA